MKKKIALTSKEVAEMRSYNELKSKNAKLEMTNERSAKKISDLTNEVSKLKLERENILKELAISKRANEKIVEKCNRIPVKRHKAIYSKIRE